MGKILVLAEKPSVGKELARVLGCRQSRDGYIEGVKYIVTWSLGHLVTLADPEHYGDKYKKWDLETLPMIPPKMEYVVIKEKGKQIKLEKYNDVNYNNRKKAENTMLEKYGVKYSMQSNELKEKSEQTCLIKYGVKYLFNSEIVKDKIRLTNIKRYGFPNVLQNAEIAEIQLKNSFKLKEFKFPCGNIIKVQGYEPFLLKILINNFNYTFNDIIVKRTEVPEIWYEEDNKKHRYYCDIYVQKTNTI